MFLIYIVYVYRKLSAEQKKKDILFKIIILLIKTNNLHLFISFEVKLLNILKVDSSKYLTILLCKSELLPLTFQLLILVENMIWVSSVFHDDNY